MDQREDDSGDGSNLSCDHKPLAISSYVRTAYKYVKKIVRDYTDRDDLDPQLLWHQTPSKIVQMVPLK